MSTPLEGELPQVGQAKVQGYGTFTSATESVSLSRP